MTYLKEFGTRLKHARELRGFSQQDVATRVGTSKSMISSYESGLSDPRQSMIPKLSDVLSVSIEWLMTGNNETGFGHPDFMAVTRQAIPLLGAVACGQPIYATEDLEALVAVGDEIDADFALRCKGDSMIDAGIYDGDIVFVKKCETVPNGAIAVVLIEDEATLKRVYRTDSELQLLAENKMYPAIIVRESDHRDVRILGAAVAYTHKIKY